MQQRRLIRIGQGSLFIIYFWFGILKVFDLSPAHNLIYSLLDVPVVAYMDFKGFEFLFGLFECMISLFWIVPKLNKLGFWIMSFHIFLTFLPIIFLPKDTWNDFLRLP